MKVIKKKIMGLLVCMLMMTTIPLAAGMTETEPDAEPTLDVGRVFLKGLLFHRLRKGNVNHALAIRLFYIEITPTERTFGWVTLNHVVFRDSAYLGRMYEVGLGLFTYIFGFFLGGLEVL
ncbi:hypothetical protein MBGDF03_00861 [Thermoplasmatales archaeon SCGC AB-540-F20]|nr:hypothetical protein MBGDF03_00861 [Thermoplasmatales archaeon SCGC AB-540-F20]